MKERRLRDGKNILFDYRDLLDKKQHKGQVLLKMKKGPITFATDNGTRFFRDHPFQWVAADEAEHLLNTFGEDTYVFFVPATIQDVEDLYALE